MGKTKEIDILDVLLILAKHKKFIFWITFIVSIAAVVYILLVPELWVSTATILPAQDQSDQLSFGGSSSLLGLGSSLLGGSMQVNGLELLIIMNSKTFSEEIIERFNLIEYMEIDIEDSLIAKEEALINFTENIRDIGINDENGLIHISIKTKDKYLSTKIANYYWEKLEEYNLRNRMSKGKQKRMFIEKRVNEVQSTISNLSNLLLKFQEKNNIIELKEQTNTIVGLYADLIADKTKKEIEMEYYLQIVDTKNPIADKLILQNEILADKILDLEINSKDKKNYILSIDSIPQLSLEYANLKMNLEIQKEVYSFLYTQFEQAKIEEIKDLPTIEIIDKAKPAGIRSEPSRAKFCITMFIISLLFSSILAYINEMIKTEGIITKLNDLKKEIVRF